METKNILIICVSIILVIAIIAGALILTGPGSIEMENKDFGPFTMDVPKGSNFNVNDTYYANIQGLGVSSHITWKNDGNYNEEVSAVFIFSAPFSNIENLFNAEGTDGYLKIYSVNKDPDKIYMVTFQKNDVELIVMGRNLGLIKKMANSIVLDSNAAEQLNISLQSSSSSSSSSVNLISSSSSSSNDASYTRYCIIHEWVTTGSDYLCPYCVQAGYPAETTADYKACPKHKDRGDGYCAYCLHPV